VNFSPNFAKLVEITQEKHIYPKFPRFSYRKKAKICSKKKNTGLKEGLVQGPLRVLGVLSY